MNSGRFHSPYSPSRNARVRRGGVFPRLKVTPLRFFSSGSGRTEEFLRFSTRVTLKTLPGGISDSQGAYAADDEEKEGQGSDLEGLNRVAVDPDHDLPEDKDEGRLGNESDLDPVGLEVFDDAPEKLDDDEHGQDVGDEKIEPLRDGFPLEDDPDVQKHPRDPDQKGEDDHRDEEIDDEIDDLVEKDKNFTWIRHGLPPLKKSSVSL